MPKAPLFLLILVFLCASTVAQEKAPWSFGVNPYYGAVFKYKAKQPRLLYTGMHGFELFAAKVTNGNRRWESMYNYPLLGVALEYYNYNDSELGEAALATTFLDFTFRKHAKTQFRINLGTGLVYSSNRYDQEERPQFTALSAPFSYTLRVTMHLEKRITENLHFNFNVGFRHFSNGRTAMPNNGMNLPIMGWGLRYTPGAQRIVYKPDTVQGFDRKVHLNAMISTSWREVLWEDDKHRAHTLSMYISKQVTKYNALLIGVDWFRYDELSVAKYISTLIPRYPTADSPTESDFEVDGRQTAVTIGTEIYLGKLWILLQGGYYIFEPAKVYTNWYQRYGFKYMITKDIFAQVTLKSHTRTADLMEFGLGLKL